MSRWLDHLESLGLLEKEGHKPTLPALLRGEPSLALDVAQRPAGPAQALRQAIQQACDWQDLEMALARVQAAFEQGELTGEGAEALAVIAAQEAQVLPELAEEERLGDLLCRQPVVRLGSRLLGEEILLAADGAQVPDGNGLVVYREAELRRVVGRPPEEVRAIHTVKKVLEGEVMGGD